MDLRGFSIICFTALTTLCGCSRAGNVSMSQARQSILVGGLYATKDKDGSWRVMKVLAVDDHAVHLRSYANKFPEQPKDVDPAKLTLGGVNDPGGFGIGHYPVAKEGFFNDNPVLLKVVPVEEQELEGYKLYLEAMKGGR